MAQDANRQSVETRSDGFVVRAPRVTDSIGQSLRHAFDRNRRLPGDLTSLLGALDRIN